LCALRGTPELDALPEGWGRDTAEAFLTRLSRSGHYSIDAFLETTPEHAPLGKYLIAREMKTHEMLDGLFPPNHSGWYQYLFNALLAPNGRPQFSGNKLGIITFNYDRSLEAYLHAALQNRFRLDEAAAAEVLAALPIIHVHGILGDYPAIPYQTDCSTTELLGISDQIQIISEIADQDEEFCNPMFRAGNAMLRGAERIFFLGFGFHPDNVRRFQFFLPENVEGKLLRGTIFGVGSIDRANLVARLVDAGFKDSDLPPDGTSCDNFFSHAVSLI